MPLIIDSEMPNNCQTCPMRDQAMCKAGLFDITTNEDLEERHPDCPIKGKLSWSDLRLLNHCLYQNSMYLHDILDTVISKEQSELGDIPKQDIISHMSEHLAEIIEIGERLIEIVKDNYDDDNDDNDFYDPDDEDFDGDYDDNAHNLSSPFEGRPCESFSHAIARKISMEILKDAESQLNELINKKGAISEDEIGPQLFGIRYAYMYNNEPIRSVKTKQEYKELQKEIKRAIKMKPDIESGKLRTFFRVEAEDIYTGETKCGYMSALYTALANYYKVKPDNLTPEFLAEKSKEEDPIWEVSPVLLLTLVGDIPVPEEYTSNNKNVCLYSPETFIFDEVYELKRINDFIAANTNLFLICKEFYLTNEEILYEDDYQCVISKETYDKHNIYAESEVIDLLYLEEDEDYDDIFPGCNHDDCDCGPECPHHVHGHDDEKILPFRRKDS